MHFVMLEIEGIPWFLAGVLSVISGVLDFLSRENTMFILSVTFVKIY